MMSINKNLSFLALASLFLRVVLVKVVEVSLRGLIFLVHLTAHWRLQCNTCTHRHNHTCSHGLL